MTYLESVMILIGWYGAIAVIAAITAASSPTWFDWASPGIQMARFFGSFWSNHTPLLHLAFAFPLLMQAPSMNTVTSWHCGIGLGRV